MNNKEIIRKLKPENLEIIFWLHQKSLQIRADMSVNSFPKFLSLCIFSIHDNSINVIKCAWHVIDKCQ